MELKKYRWAKTYEAGEDELEAYLEQHHYDAERWTADEEESFAPHVHAKDKKLWCAEGSIHFKIDGKKTIPLQAGDALNLPAYTMHEAVAGFAGCIMYESPHPAENPPLPAE